MTDANGRPISVFGELDPLDRVLFPQTHIDWFREAPHDKGISACIPGPKARKIPVKYDKFRNRIEIMFGRLKDWPIVGKTVPQTVF